jgi:hypothetical protein
VGPHWNKLLAMRMRIWSVGVLLLVVGSLPAVAQSAKPISACELAAHRKDFDQKEVLVEGFIFHGFEEFNLSDFECLGFGPRIWLEYGGRERSPTMYCCGNSPNGKSAVDLNVEGIAVPLKDDEKFRQLNALMQLQTRSAMARVTLRGRFFAGHNRLLLMKDGEKYGMGYGHMGCCSLFVIEQVVDVGAQADGDIDYRAEGDTGETKNSSKCGTSGIGFLYLSTDVFKGWVAQQKEAEEKNDVAAFNDPVAAAFAAYRAAKHTEPGNDEAPKTIFTPKAGAVVEWRDAKSKSYVRVDMGRPYLLTFSARDPEKIVWVAQTMQTSRCKFLESFGGHLVH